MPPRAIETKYKGYRFRSRLEARWAVFFDHLGLQWEYEPEGFELPGGVRYLPDFRVSGARGSLWFEVKPTPDADDSKPRLFCSEGRESICVVHGLPDRIGYKYYEFSQGGVLYDALVFVPPGFNKYAPWYFAWGEFEPGGGVCWNGAPSLVAAINAARGARFEFGERGVRR